ncbi:unnamed protein product [Schistocephalus solidus]|uniref:ABC transmembrane type-1 domain-containing protein n=1 Tax=Schistocephalus solidus TaxID=70667 RepID=A0A183TI41_SCHSO|nr:unnamed protein product [Schistocephalus solidus]
MSNTESLPASLVKQRRSSENQLASVPCSKVSRNSTSTLDNAGHLNNRSGATCNTLHCDTNRRNTCAHFPGLRSDRVSSVGLEGDLNAHGASRALSHGNVKTDKSKLRPVRCGNLSGLQFSGTSRNARRSTGKTVDAEPILRTDHPDHTVNDSPKRTSNVSADHLTNISGKNFSDNADHPVPAAGDEKPVKKKLNCGLIRALLATYWPALLVSAFFKLCHDLFLFCGPLLLKRLIGFLENDKNEPLWHGYLYASAMFLVAMLQSFVLHQYFRRQGVIGMNIRSVLVSAVYRKVSFVAFRFPVLLSFTVNRVILNVLSVTTVVVILNHRLLSHPLFE